MGAPRVNTPIDPCGVQNTTEQWTPQGNSLRNLDPTGEFFRKGNNTTTIAGPPQATIGKGACVGVCVCLYCLPSEDILQ